MVALYVHIYRYSRGCLRTSAAASGVGITFTPAGELKRVHVSIDSGGLGFHACIGFNVSLVRPLLCQENLVKAETDAACLHCIGLAGRLQRRI